MLSISSSNVVKKRNRRDQGQGLIRDQGQSLKGTRNKQTEGQEPMGSPDVEVRSATGRSNPTCGIDVQDSLVRSRKLLHKCGPGLFFSQHIFAVYTNVGVLDHSWHKEHKPGVGRNNLTEGARKSMTSKVLITSLTLFLLSIG